MPRSASKNAEAREKTQVALLEAGATLVRRLPADALLSQIRVRDVAVEAGVSPAAIYHYWPTQQEFRRALAAYLLEPKRFRSQGELADAVAAIDAETKRTGRPSIRGAARAGARTNIERILATDATRLQMALWANHEEGDVAALLRRMYAALADDFVPLYRNLPALDNRRYRPPFTAEHLAVAIAALTEGFTLRWAVDPDAVPTDLNGIPRLLGEAADDGEPPWDLYSACVYFLAACMTESADAGEAGSAPG